MNRLKIAHVTTVDYSLRDLLLNQLQSLQSAGFEVVGISSSGTEVTAIEAAGIRHIAVSMSRRLTPLADMVSTWKLCQVMRRERFCVVHTHTPKAGLLGQMAAKMAGGAIVINTVHGFYFHEHMTGRSRHFFIQVEKAGAFCSDLILSQNMEDIYTAVYENICALPKIRYIGNGIDLRQFHPSAVTEKKRRDLRQQLNIPLESPVIGFVGRLAARRKGFSDFLAAATILSKKFPTARFLIVGDPDIGKSDAIFPSAAEDYGIAEQCIFTGLSPNADLPAIYSLMNVLVLPSLFEGVPRVVMEASAMGIPSVVSDVKGNREAVVHAKTGFIVPLGDVPAIAAAISQVISDENLRQQLSKAGRIFASEHFDEQMVFDRIRSEYAALLRAKRGIDILSLPNDSTACSVAAAFQ
ncbi:MAG: glycosyl transferase group 1 [Chthoniobacteraceae bacterium]|nr:glycosyl transferase group 1 [Chthoniobacteraceae bacterium]